MTALFWLLCTIVVYMVSKLFYRSHSKVYLTPLIIAPFILIALLICFKVPFAAYNEGAGLLSDLMEPAAIALAVTLYKYFDEVKKNSLIIVVCVSFGAIIAILTSVGLSQLFGLSEQIIDSLAPRSATTPIAVTISGRIGGLPAITAAATIITGIMSMIIGPYVVKWFHIQSPLARGVLFGTSSHSSGVRKAFEYDDMSGAVAAIAMMVTAFITIGAAPWLVQWLQ